MAVSVTGTLLRLQKHPGEGTANACWTACGILANKRLRRVLSLSASFPVAAAVWTGGGHQAHGQVIDQYLNASIPGYDTAAGVTVATRQHPEYNAQGVRLVFSSSRQLSKKIWAMTIMLRARGMQREVRLLKPTLR